MQDSILNATSTSKDEKRRDGYALPKSSAALLREGMRSETEEVDELQSAAVFRVLLCINFASSLPFALQKRRTEGTLIICRNSPAEAYVQSRVDLLNEKGTNLVFQRVTQYSAVSGHRLAFLRHAP